jgi:hypothetical protein
MTESGLSKREVLVREETPSHLTVLTWYDEDNFRDDLGA